MHSGAMSLSFHLHFVAGPVGCRLNVRFTTIEWIWATSKCQRVCMELSLLVPSCWLLQSLLPLSSGSRKFSGRGKGHVFELQKDHKNHNLRHDLRPLLEMASFPLTVHVAGARRRPVDRTPDPSVVHRLISSQYHRLANEMCQSHSVPDPFVLFLALDVPPLKICLDELCVCPADNGFRRRARFLCVSLALIGGMDVFLWVYASLVAEVIVFSAQL